MFIIYKYFNFKNFEKSIEFTLRYAVISLIVNIIMIITTILYLIINTILYIICQKTFNKGINVD